LRVKHIRFFSRIGALISKFHARRLQLPPALKPSKISFHLFFCLILVGIQLPQQSLSRAMLIVHEYRVLQRFISSCSIKHAGALISSKFNYPKVSAIFRRGIIIFVGRV